MKDKKRKHPKSPDHIGNANKGPKKSDSSVSGYLVTDTRGGISYTPVTRPPTPTQDIWTWQGDPMPDTPTPSPSKSAEQTASTPSNPIGKFTSADIASITSWKPRFTVEQLLSSSDSPPASQDSEPSEGTVTNWHFSRSFRLIFPYTYEHYPSDLILSSSPHSLKPISPAYSVHR